MLQSATGNYTTDLEHLVAEVLVPRGHRAYGIGRYEAAIALAALGREAKRDKTLKAALLAAGYGWLRCTTHRSWGCDICRCDRCGGSHECGCDEGRKLRPYRCPGPRLPRKPTKPGDRRIGIEIEAGFASSKARQAVLAAYPYVSSDGSIRPDYSGELKFAGRSDKLADLASDLRRILAKAPGRKADRSCGLHVHVERGGEDESTLVERWRAVQEDLYAVMPHRREGMFSRPVTAWNVRDHYSSMSRSTKPTWEVRIHPGTTSWLVAVCWADWCHQFVTGTDPDEIVGLGRAYLRARKAHHAVVGGDFAAPDAWIAQVERVAVARGVRAALDAVARGEFAAFEDASTLAEAARVAGVALSSREEH